jgi:hypothetical protein
MDELVPFGSSAWLTGAASLLAARALDLLSTWFATPSLVMEGNPLVKRLGWRWSIFFNLALCGGIAFYPLGAVVGCTTSVLVAARNLQSAWAVRVTGEESYSHRREELLSQATPGLFLACVFGEATLLLLVGSALVWAAGPADVPLGIGLGIVTYAVAVAFFMTISLWRNRRPAR